MTPRQQLESKLCQWLRSHHDVIGYHEARSLGAPPGVIRYKLDRGGWERLYEGVYRDATAPRSPYQDLRAAYLATKGLGVASHASAAWVWGLLPHPPDVAEVTVPVGKRHAPRKIGFVIHQSRDLELSTAVNRNGILVTNPLRTLVDVAGSALPEQLTEAVDTALARHLVTTVGLQAEIDRRARRGRNGVAVLRHHLLDRGFIGAPEPSVLEAHTRRLVGGTGLATPDLELRVGDDGQYRLDLAWAAVFFAVEVDGYVWHFSPEHMRRDHDRRNHLQQAGWTLLVYTWRQVLNEPARVAQQITDTYRRLSGPG